MMTAEDILARVNAIMADCAETPALDALQRLAADLSDQVRQEYAAKKGVGNAAAALRNMLKTAKKQQSERTALHYAWTDKQGRQCVCDGFRAFRLFDPLPLEPRPENAGEAVDLDKIFPAIDAKTHNALPLPKLADVKAHIAIERAKTGRKAVALWDFGPGRPVVNAAYLIDLLTVLPDASEIYAMRGDRGLICPLYAKSERGDAVLLPVKCSDHEACGVQAQKIANAEKMLSEYAEKRKRDHAHSMSLDSFADLAQLAYQPA